MDNRFSSGKSRSTKLRDRFNFEKPNLFAADMSSEITKNADGMPPVSSRNLQKRHIQISATENGELVKYMSNVPSYLEKGEKLKEKALSFGVLDWRSLQKWQYNHNKQAYQSKYSPSSSNISSFFSTDRSSTNSSRCQSRSPAHQRLGRPTLQYFFNAFPKEDHSQDSSGITMENSRSFEVHKGQKSNSRVYESSSKNSSKMKMKDSNCIDAEPKKVHAELEVSEEATHSKGKKEVKQPKSINVKNTKSLSISPTRGNNSEDKPLKVMPLNSDPKNSIWESPRPRDPSTRRFSIGLGKIGRASSSKDGFSAMQLGFEHAVIAKSGSRKFVPSLLGNSSRNKAADTSKSQFSPMRRLLDPLLKPKAVKSYSAAKSSDKDQTPSTIRACKSLYERVELCTAYSEKIIDADLDHNGKKGLSMVQAHCQITIKNGLPLFTFVYDNANRMLAATMRKATDSKKDDNLWICTFFNFQGIKRKNSWLNQVNSSKSHGYIPNVVAQMSVSVHSSDVLTTREYVLFSINSNEAGWQKGEFQQKMSLLQLLSIIGFSQDPLSTTVILPGGVHGLPGRGEPSTLIERWKSGGLCDCGGWDLGCRIKVLANENKCCWRSGQCKVDNAADRFELFSQGEVESDRPVFSLCPFKDGIFSVEFSSSLSCLQAFTICIAVLNNPCELQN
ncbi:hypothetical protein NMG60_11034146 [Bertholletia excelsa]